MVGLFVFRDRGSLRSSAVTCSLQAAARVSAPPNLRPTYLLRKSASENRAAFQPIQKERAKARSF